MVSKSQRGAGFMEYLLLLALIIVVVISAVKGFGEFVGITFSQISSVVEDPNGYQG